METVPCHVCQMKAFTTVFSHRPAMSSDGATVDFLIEKEECSRCGTIRTKETSLADDFYKNEYSLNAENLDPIFVYRKESYRKSELHFEWIQSLLDKNFIEIKHCLTMLEIGCGSGNLLARFDIADKHGIEPNRQAAAHARKIAEVRNDGYEAIENHEAYDLILSSCVIEHTFKPNDFLQKIYNILSGDGTAIIGLPLQDTESFDVFFLDHLHHFTVRQFARLCEDNGFDIVDYEVGYKCMTTLGYFVLSKRINGEKSFVPPPIYERNKNFDAAKKHLSNLENFLNAFGADRIYAFGYGETSFFFQTYSAINKFVKIYIDDTQADGGNVLSTEEFLERKDLRRGDDGAPPKIILLTNPHYNEFIKEKFSKLSDVDFFSPFQEYAASRP